MHATKFKPFFNLATINKECIRTAGLATQNVKPWKEIPGPKSLPLVGQLHHFMFGGPFAKMEDPDATMRLIETYGPIIRLDSLFGRSATIFLSDPESVAYILRSENWTPVRPGFQSLEYYRKHYRKSKGMNFHATGLISDHGDVWKEFRSIVNPVMLQPNTIKLYKTVLDEVAQDMIKRMRANRDEKNMITKDFDKEMNLWALESVSTVALGLRLNCFNPNLPSNSPELQLIQCVRELFTTATEIDFKPNLWRMFSTPLFKRTMKMYEHHDKDDRDQSLRKSELTKKKPVYSNFEKIRVVSNRKPARRIPNITNLTKYFIQKGKDNLKNKSDNEKGVLEKLLEINEEAAHIMAIDTLFAGVDTAANTVTAILYLLAKNPEKQTKLREEIMSDTERRPYLRACIKEAMRMMPVVSGNARKSSKEYHILGYAVPKGVDIIFTHKEMSLMEKHYPRANEYIPERWIVGADDPLYYGNTHPFVYGAFGYGARGCIGRRIAELEMNTFVARLIENFQVEWFGPPPKVVAKSLNYIQGPYNFIFKDIK